MPMLRRLPAAAAVVALCLLTPVSPALASGADVLRDCNDHGRLTKEYSQREYRQALAQIPSDLKQYTDCENIIRRAQLGQPVSPGGDANAGNPFGTSATPEEVAQANKDIAAARKSGGTRQKIGGSFVTPGALSFTKVSAATSELPTPLLVLIVLILVGTAAFVFNFVRDKRRERPGDPGA
ncbi:MAG: hypothetical protein JWM73_1538 [Solirubrobacterales bacterium]|nr:hypothetical protein [Solirubrobacterales bacterium]